MDNITRFEWVSLAVVVVCFLSYVTIHKRAKSAYDLQAYVKKWQNYLPTDSVSTLFYHANNGDLVFFCGDTRGERTCRWCTGSIFSHVALLFREIHPQTQEDIVYVWEADVGHKYKRGPRVMKLEDKLRNYHGYHYLMWRKLSHVRPTTENILKVVEMYKNYDFDDNMISWWLSDTLFHSIAKSNKVFCSELIALTFQSEHINMMNKDRVAAWYSPGTFTEPIIPGMHKDCTYNGGTYVNFQMYKDK